MTAFMLRAGQLVPAGAAVGDDQYPRLWMFLSGYQ